MTPKPILREMVFIAMDDMRPVSDILCDLADVVSTLEVLRLFHLNVIADDIQRLVAANPRLTTVEVDFHDYTLAREQFELDDERDDMRRIKYAPPEAAEEAAVQFVDVLSRCTALKEMVISNKTLNSSPISKRISESCRAFREKDVDIFVGGAQYIP